MLDILDMNDPETADEATKAFDQAIQEGRLSDDENADNYGGLYMYMGVANDGRTLFKHMDTRQYLP